MKKLLNLSEKLAKYLVAAALVIVPLLPKFPLIKVSGTYVAIRFEDILMLSLGLLLIPKFILDYKKIFKDKIISAFLIFFGVTLLSIISGLFVSHTIELKLGLLNWARRLEYILPFLVTYLLIPREKIKEAILFYLKILIIVVAIVFIYGFGQRYAKFPIIVTQNEEYSKGIALLWTVGSHINSTFAGHYDLSSFVVLVSPILLAAFVLLKDKFLKYSSLVSSAAALWLLISSISRTAQASFLLAVTTTFFLLKKFKAWVVIIAVSLVFMIMSSGLDARFTQAIKVLYEHITTGKAFGYVPGFVAHAEGVTLTVRDVVIATPTPAPVKVINDVSISIRYNVEWPRALRAFYKNPILGSGYSSIGLATDNDYLRMLAETGILGFSAFILVLLRIAKVFWQGIKMRSKLDSLEKVFLFGLIGGLVGTFLTASLIDLFEASKFAIIFWLFVGCAVSLIKYKRNEG